MKNIIKTNTTALLVSSLLVISAALSSGCGEKPPPPKDEEVTTDTASTSARMALDQIFVNIPPPMELSKELSKAGFTYNRSIVSSSSKAGGYSSNYKAAANLGVYGADLGYVTSFGQTQDALGFLNGIRQLAEKVGVGAAFDEGLVKKFEGNIANKDTMEAIINGAYDKATRNLRSNQRVSTAAIVAAGSWIEGLYISSQVLIGVEKTQKNADAYQRVWNQLYSSRYVEELLNMYPKNPDCAQMLKEILPMHELVEQYGKQTTLNPDEVKRINENITTIRNNIIN